MIKILIDENLPKKLKFRFGESFDIKTVSEMGWNSKKNGELLKLIQEEGFHYLLTADKNIEYQQNISALNFGLIILDVKDNRYSTVLLLVPSIMERAKTSGAKGLIKISG